MSSLEDQLKNLGFKASENHDHEAGEAAASPLDTSQPVRIQRQTKGRKGKGVTVLFDLPDSPELLAEYASALRKTCGVGGAVKDGTIELQGDQRDKAKKWLEQRGFKAKFAGG
ncbi:translation initiation factor [Pseudidiomarina sp.]|uniref:translation initiation factor n=1 Tax=Pseudidiomarina sp. TaxID=2081707 RepID=UPI003A9866B9